MTDYISREAVLSFPFANGQYDREHADEHFIHGCESYREWIEQLPAADMVEVKHGHWEFEDDDRMTWCTRAICSSCKQTVAFNADLAQDWGKRRFLKDNPFCAKCGAKMDGEIKNG